jgi:hypothetical protein
MIRSTSAFLILLLVAACGPSGPELIGTPFVEVGVDGTLSVVWSTATLGHSTVQYGRTSSLDLKVSIPGERTEHRVVLPNLRSGGYSYQVSADHPMNTFTAGVTFSRGPYLQNRTASEVSVLWSCNSNSEPSFLLSTPAGEAEIRKPDAIGHVRL